MPMINPPGPSAPPTPPHLILLPGLLLLLSAACTSVNVSPGVNLFGTDLGIVRKADQAEAVYASDMTKGQFSLHVISEDIPLFRDTAGIGGIHDTWGLNFVYQAPTGYRARQSEGDVNPTVQGQASYLAVFLSDTFSRDNEASRMMSWLADRMFFGMGLGRITMTGQADFNTADTATTSIDVTDNSAFVFFLGFETRSFLGVENLIFRGTLAEYFFENDQFEFLVGGVVWTIGYRLTLDFSGKKSSPPEKADSGAP